jgi:hypothetical protein
MDNKLIDLHKVAGLFREIQEEEFAKTEAKEISEFKKTVEALETTEEVAEELTAAQKKLPAGLRDAIAKKQGDSTDDDEVEEKVEEEIAETPVIAVIKDTPVAEEEVAEEAAAESTEPIEESSDEEVVYEIELDEEVSDEEVAEEVTETEEETDESEEEEETPEADMEEASRTHAADARVPSNQGKKYKAGRADLSEDIETLKTKNGELTEALKVFRDKLNEVGVFNANLAYATRLFTEHTTTKSEKLNILKRFDGIETLKESKSLYNSIKNELTASDTKLTETVVNKISSSPKSGSSEKLVESKTYENPQIRRIKEMMGIVK